MRAALLLVVAACGSRAASAPPSNTAPAVASTQPPDLARLQGLLAPHASHRFAGGSLDRGCSAMQTLGAYLAELETSSRDGDRHHFTGTCGAFPAQLAPVDPPSDPAYWYCVIDAFAETDGEPWHYELRLRVRKRDEAVDLTTLGCPGTP